MFLMDIDRNSVQHLINELEQLVEDGVLPNGLPLNETSTARLRSSIARAKAICENQHSIAYDFELTFRNCAMEFAAAGLFGPAADGAGVVWELK